MHSIFMEYIKLHSILLGIFGVPRLVLHAPWSTFLSTPTFWRTSLQHAKAFGVPACRSQKIGVHVANYWSALRLTQILSRKLDVFCLNCNHSFFLFLTISSLINLIVSLFSVRSSDVSHINISPPNL
jgi:hypothetical protein